MTIPGIGDHAAIGDGRALALVSREGSIDWLCLPDQDSPSVFAAILDTARGGSFTLAPSVPFEASRRYAERTNVLETEFRTDGGVVRVTDAMTLDIGQRAPWRELVRKVEAVSGRVPMRWRCEPRFDFGRQSASFEPAAGAWVARCGGLEVGVQAFAAGEATVSGGVLAGAFEAGDGERALLALTCTQGEPLPIPGRDELERRLEATFDSWRRWISRHGYDGRWRDAVERSLLALKLLSDPRTGCLLAAGTTSLPEKIGGSRNFDYRYGWVRDAAFAMDALLRTGFDELAHRGFTWLLRATEHTHPRLNPVYHADGSPLKSQHELELAGYRGSTPVHVGNQAGSQRQLGSWGDFLETAYLYTDHGHLLDPETGARMADLCDVLTQTWRNKDAGLWEIDDADYATSKMSCWTAFKRVLDLAERGQVPARSVARWMQARDAVREHIETKLWSEQKRSYLMQVGAEKLDCGTLLAARRGFADAQGERMQGTIAAIRSELSAGGPLLYRYSGMQEQENAFLACSFWLVEALSLSHRFDEAAETMDELVGLGTDVGLYSEEMDPSSKEMLGNYPQALTHLSLLTAASLFEEAQESASGGAADRGSRTRKTASATAG